LSVPIVSVPGVTTARFSPAHASGVAAGLSTGTVDGSVVGGSDAALGDGVVPAEHAPSNTAAATTPRTLEVLRMGGSPKGWTGRARVYLPMS
jgi:hypothetical protein